ncbi:recombination mediator RecR [Bacteroidia bacterium]|jgi:recombination protein RecR|nr:recombination protein RecR [Bacteroidota bacterium]MDA8930775.1 recombination mediator RecR [Bacteroidia bacterium]MDB4174555.1 recombination mediator RecR [Bacteroidia bacterium]
MSTSSNLINKAVEQLSKFPGVGHKSALRMALHLLKKSEGDTIDLSQALINMRTEIKFCRQCFNISDAELCNVCNSPSKDESVVCVVKDFQDVIAIENTGQYNGHFHVLGGLISPVDGIGPSDIKIPQLLARVEQGTIKEAIIALSSTLEGDTTEYYIAKKLRELNLKVSTLSKGISVGGELEYADEMTLARSIRNRVNLEG